MRPSRRNIGKARAMANILTAQSAVAEMRPSAGNHDVAENDDVIVVRT
jgi:hypothetical protein